MSDVVFENLRMALSKNLGHDVLSLAVESGVVGYEINLPITARDRAVLQGDNERAAFLQATLHHVLQQKKTHLDDIERRRYLDAVLHSPIDQVEAFLTELDHGPAHGAVSNAVRITSGYDPAQMRGGRWFRRESSGDD